MADIGLILAGIEFKVRKLIDSNKQLKKSNEELQQKNAEYQQQIEILLENNNHLTQQLNNRIITNTLGSEIEVDESRKVIQALVREVDQCIAILNK
jgi:hypothetical protein